MTAAERSYHHGDLPAALLDAVDAIVRERGPGAVTLREAARRAGVSHAAPAHHFGDKAGLLTAYAVQGFEAMARRMDAAREQDAVQDGGEQDGGGRDLTAIGLAYIAFAVEEPGRFTVMFRPEVLDPDRPEYRASCDAAFEPLQRAVTDLRGDLAPDDPEVLHAAVGAWSIVHGFATLWLDGNLDEAVTSLPAAEAADAALTAFGRLLFVAAGVGLESP